MFCHGNITKMSSESEDSDDRVCSESDANELTSESDAYFEEGNDQQASHTSITPEDGVQEDKVMIALPPKEREGSDYHTIILSGSSALDVLDQVS